MDRQELIDEVYEALSNAQDYDTTLTDFAKAVVDHIPLVSAAPDLLAAMIEARETLAQVCEGSTPTTYAATICGRLMRP